MSEEQRELAWLVTRAAWGDLRATVDGHDAAAAEELSRALRRRLSLAHPPLLRAIAALSWLSLRRPYALASERFPYIGRIDRDAA